MKRRTLEALGHVGGYLAGVAFLVWAEGLPYRRRRRAYTLDTEAIGRAVRDSTKTMQGK